MNFHLFVGISTLLFYIFLKFYKSNIEKNKKSNSNLLYLSFLPIMLYITRYFYLPISKISGGGSVNSSSSTSISVSEDLMSIPYPESSFKSSN